MSLPPLPSAAIALGLHIADWRGAVRAAGEALVRSGSTESAYTERMIDVIDEFGAYIVIAPGLALAHARPGTDVLTDGVSIVTLAEPVAFGHPHNDPVRVVVGLAVSTVANHVPFVAELANVFNDATVIPALAAARDVATVRRLLGLPAEHASGEVS